MSAPAKISVRVLRSIQAVDPSAWDALCGEDTVFSHGWFRALEESRVAAVEPRHLLLEQNGRVAAILPCFIQSGDPYYSLADRLFGPLARFCSGVGLQVLPALLAYSPLAHRTELFLAPGVDRVQAVKACVEAMERICREEHLRVSGWPFVSESDELLRATLQDTGHAQAFVSPAAIWTNRYPTFNDYLQGLKQVSNNCYKAAREELNRHTRSGVRIAQEPIGAIAEDELAAMRAVTYREFYPNISNPFTPDFFAALKRHVADRIFIHTARKDGVLLGYSLVGKGKHRWHEFFNGAVADEQSHADKLHFNLNYYFPIREAIDAGVSRIDFGLSSYRVKVRRGCKLQKLDVFLRPHSRSLRLWLPGCLSLVNCWYRRKYRAVTGYENGSTAVMTDGAAQTAEFAQAKTGWSVRFPALRALATYSASTYMASGLSLARGMWLAYLLGPTGFGAWRLVKMLTGYVSHLPLGSVHALRLELPSAIGAGRHALARGMAQSVLSFNVLIGFGTSAVCLMGAWGSSRWWPGIPAWLWLAIAALAPVQLAYEFMVAKLTAEERVAYFSGLTLALAALAAIGMPLGAIWAGLTGALAGLFLAYALPLVWLAWKRQLPAWSLPDAQILKRLWKTGLPLWIVWLPVFILPDIDQWLVAGQLGTSALGVYGIAVFLGGLLRFVPTIFRGIYQPFLLRRLGAADEWSSVRPFLVDSLRFMAYISPIAIASLFFVVDPLMRVFLPAYASGLLAAKLYCLGAFWQMLIPITFMVCLAARRFRVWFIQTIIILAAHVLITRQVLSAGGGLEGAALCTGIVYAIYALWQMYLTLTFFDEGFRAWARVAGSIVIPFGASVLVCMGLEAVWSLPTGAAGVLIGSIGRLAVALGILAGLYRLMDGRLGFSRVLRARVGVAQASYLEMSGGV